MKFKDVRRQKFLGEARAKELEEDLRESTQRTGRKMLDEKLIPAARSSFAWAAASESLQLLILRYTAGYPLVELAKELPAVIQAFDNFIPLDNPRPNEAHTLTITQHEAYVYVLWLLCLCQLLGHAELVPIVLGWLNRNAEFNRGRDGLFEAIVEKLTGHKVNVDRVLLHRDAYRSLAKATVVEPHSNRPAQVKEFIEQWYKKMKPCYWHGTHTDGEGSSYFGYWCFEAALVTYLWEIDDSSYRDHLVYPKDLVDYARKNHPHKGPYTGAASAPPRTPAGEPCPKEGYWFTPANSDSRRHFKQGEVMPDFKNPLWATLWQWDENQREPEGS